MTLQTFLLLVTTAMNSIVYSSLSNISMPMTSENNENLTPTYVNYFNGNGLGHEAKQNVIFKKLKQKNSIILQQETHFTPQFETK